MNNTTVTIQKDSRKRKKPWLVRWYGEYDPAAGKQQRYCKSFKLKTNAEKFQAAKTHEFNQGNERDRKPDAKLSAFCEDWLKSRKTELQPATYDLYAMAITRLKEYFGENAFLKDITPKNAALFLAAQKNRWKGYEDKDLSDWSREQIKSQCKAIFTTAVDWGNITKNPFKTLRRKKLTVKRWHMIIIEEFFALMDVAPSLRWQIFYALAYTSGARFGELFSLTWTDIDFATGSLIIANRDATDDMPPFHVKDHEARTIPLPPFTIDLLTKWQAQAPENVPYVLLTAERYERVKVKWQQFQKAGKSWRNRYMVNNVLRDFKSQARLAGIKPTGTLTIHTLRKSCGQNWADNMSIHVVKELMGHSSIATTQEFYTQVDKEHQARAAQTVQKLLVGVGNNDRQSA